MDALIGYTGFVGGVLARAHQFGALYNRSNIESIRGRSFERLVCAGAPAVKWLANKEPEQDRAAIVGLADALCACEARHVVLISTIDVYPVLEGVDEHFDCSMQSNHAYGAHRLLLEARLTHHFEKVTIIRLPALFGPGLKKNIVFDLLHDNCLDMIQPRSVFQWYPLEQLWDDIKRVIEAQLPVVNLFPEPIQSAELIARVFPDHRDRVGLTAGPPIRYNLQTAYGKLWGQEGPYRMSRTAVLDALGAYVNSIRAERSHGGVS